MQIKVWQTNPEISRTAAAIKVGDIQQIAFEFPGFTDENGMPWWQWSNSPHFDVPHLVLKQPAQFNIVLHALRSAKVLRKVTELWKPYEDTRLLYRMYAVVIKLKSGDHRVFRFENTTPEGSFGPPFRAVLRLLADDSARQVREAVAKVQHTIKAVRGASGKEWRNPSDVQAIVAELLKVDRSFFEYENYSTDPPPRVVKVQHDKDRFSIGFVVYDKQLISRYRWL